MCLEGMLDRYVDALVARNPSTLPLAPVAKFTGNGQRLENGAWTAGPWAWQIAEVFKIEHGLIGPVESVLHQVPYGMGSGWSTWEEAMSSEPREVR
jgi:hypothetical protein